MPTYYVKVNRVQTATVKVDAPNDLIAGDKAEVMAEIEPFRLDWEELEVKVVDVEEVKP